MSKFAGTTLLALSVVVSSRVFAETPKPAADAVPAVPVFAQASSAVPAIGYSQSGLPLAAAVAPGSAGTATGGATASAAPGSAPGAGGATPVPAAPGPSLQSALDAAQLAIRTCQGLDQKVGVTVLDSGGIPKVVLATDGASPRGVQSSTNKALTALAFKSATSDLGERSKSDSALAEKIGANPIYNTRAGGLIITRGGEVIGAIGVGGAKGSEKDEACAKAALTALQG